MLSPENVNEVDRPLARLTKVKREEEQMIDIKNEVGEGPLETQQILKGQ